jgi:hypothetical protein
MALTWMDVLALDDTQLFEQCEFDRFRASGPGGQKRNRTNSAVRLRHRPTGLQAEANESRSQHENRARALRRLRITAAVSLRAPLDVATYEPPDVLLRALDHPPGRRDVKLLPAIAALFDVLEACAWRVSEAAELLGTNSAAVTRLLMVDDRVWRAATERRQALELPPLRHTR